MKQYLPFLLALCCCCILTFPIFGQRKPITYKIVAYKSLEDPLGYKKLSFDVELMIKDSQGNILYTETHHDTLNDIAESKINIGEGENQSMPYDSVDLAKADVLCNKVTIHDPAGDIVIMTEDRFSQNAFSSLSENTDALGNVAWSSNPVSAMDLYMPPQDVAYCIPVVRKVPMTLGRNYFNQIQMTDYVRSRNKPSAVNANPINFLHIGTGKPCPAIFGTEEIDEVENYYTFYPGQMGDYYNAFAVKVPQEINPYGHSTSAVYAENIFDPLGVGVYANGLNRGSYNAGRTGSFSLCNNITGNGAATWGYVLNGAGTGNANYAVLGSANNQANAYAGYFDGNVYVSGMVTQGSDRILKTNIRTSTYGLNTLLQLRPMIYEFASNTPYSLPKGDHFGFIAQEMEEVMPELVSDMVLPLSLDPDKMSTSGTTSIKGINYTELIPVMTMAIQELNAKVETLAAEVERLNKELAAVKPPK